MQAKADSICYLMSGVTLPLLQQAIILFQLALSGAVLGKKIEVSQVRPQLLSAPCSGVTDVSFQCMASCLSGCPMQWMLGSATCWCFS